MAQYLQQSQHIRNVGRVYWQYHRNDHRQITLLLIPPTLDEEQSSKSKKKQKKQKQAETVQVVVSRTKHLKFRVQLVFGMDSLEWIPSLRLVPNRCNLQVTERCTSSQMYNQLLIEDAFIGLPYETGDEMDEETFHEIEKVLHATCLLAKTWCLQRGLLRAHDGLDTEQLLALIIYLFRTRQANPRMAPIQVLATLWKLLASTDWSGETDSSVPTQQLRSIRAAPSESFQENKGKSTKHAALVMPLQGKTESQTIAICSHAEMYAQQTKQSPLTDEDPPTLLDLWQTQYFLGPVFLDSSMRHNFLGRCSFSYMRDLSHQAHLALDRLHERQAFETLFMQRARFWARFDVFMRVPLNEVVFGSDMWGMNRKDLGDNEAVTRGVLDILHQALGNRVRAIRLFSTGNGAVVRKTEAVCDSDEMGSHLLSETQGKKLKAPDGSSYLVVGLTLNTETCNRVVDRGPPADDAAATAEFVKLWGTKKAQLRRFKDGAIVHAVVWDSSLDETESVAEKSYMRFQNDDAQQGGIVERIMRHIFSLHFLKSSAPQTELQFSLRNVLSAVDGVIQREPSTSYQVNAVAAHRTIIKAFESLSDFLRSNSTPTVAVEGSDEMTSRLGVPLAVDAVEPVSPALRYAELFPPIPHADLGAVVQPRDGKISGVVMSAPIEIQIRFGTSSKWPTDIKAIGAAKSAMLVSVVDGIESMKRSGLAKNFDGSIHVTSSYADIGYMGFVFRVRVRADPELKLLRGLSNPNHEAVALLKLLTKRHVIAAVHHSMVHAVYTSHPSSSAVTRLARKWVASHLLSGIVPFEAIELLVVYVYTNKSSARGSPGSVTAGFLQFLQLLGEFDWAKQPLVVDPQGHFDDDMLNDVHNQFEKVRGVDFKRGPPMYIVSPTETSASVESMDNAYFPYYTEVAPETVILLRAAALARRTFEFLVEALVNFDKNTWSAAFHETAASFRSYSALLRIDLDFCIDPSSASTGSDLGVKADRLGVLVSAYTRSMKQRTEGPKCLQRKAYRNLENHNEDLVLEFNPVDQVVREIRNRLGEYLLVFYNDLCPEVLSILWRRPRLTPHAFSAVASEFVRPIQNSEWRNDTLVTLNVKDLLRAMTQITQGMVVDVKVFDKGPAIHAPSKKKINEGNKRNSDVVAVSSDDSDSNEEYD